MHSKKEKPDHDFSWVNIGREAFGLVHNGRIEALLYWSPAMPCEDGGPGGEPGVLDPAYSVVWAARPFVHTQVMEGDDYQWERAMEEAARMYLVSLGLEAPRPGDEGFSAVHEPIPPTRGR